MKYGLAFNDRTVVVDYNESGDDDGVENDGCNGGILMIVIIFVMITDIVMVLVLMRIMIMVELEALMMVLVMNVMIRL